VDAKPALGHGRVYVPSRDGNVYAVNAGTGALDWVYRTGGETRQDFWDFYLSDPLVLGTTVIFGSGDGSVHAVRHDTGESIWRFDTGGPVHAAPVADDAFVYVGGFNGVLRAVDPASGATRWTFQTPASREHFLRVHDADGELNPEMRELYRTGRGLEAENRILELGSIARTPTREGTTLYFGCTEGTVYALEVPPAGRGREAVLQYPATARRSGRQGPPPASPRSRRCGVAPAPTPTSRHGRAPPGERRRCGGHGCPGRTGGSRSSSR
jgi:outer membrane protein assembly factor BamB